MVFTMHNAQRTALNEGLFSTHSAQRTAHNEGLYFLLYYLLLIIA